jgi:predicted amino acid-binding ACT domain protein
MAAALARPRDRRGLGAPADRRGRLSGGRLVEAADRSGLLRDISEVFAKEKINVTGVHPIGAEATGGTAYMTFTVERPTTRPGWSGVLRQVGVQVRRACATPGGADGLLEFSKPCYSPGLRRRVAQLVRAPP